jgi:zinc protease
MKLIHQRSIGFPITQVILVLPRTGACLDPARRRGLARLTLRLMQSGAGGLSNAELNGRLERLGAVVGFSLANDHLSLRLTALTENLNAALELFLTMLHRPNFDEREFSRLREELVSSWIADREESKSLRAQEMYLALTYRDQAHAYPSDGTLDGLRAVTVDHVREHWPALLGRDEPLLAVLTNLGKAEVEARIAARITLPPPREGLPHPWDGFQAPRNGGRRVVLVPDRETNTDEVLLGGFTTSELDPQWHLHRLAALIFGGDMNSRLFRVLRGEHGYSYGANCWYETSHGHSPRNRISPFTVYTFPTAEHTAQAIPLVVRLYEELVTQGVTADELQRAQQALVNSYPFQLDTPQKKLGAELDLALYGVRMDDEDTHREKLLGATPADILRMLQATHRPGLANIVLLGDPGRLDPVARAIPGIESLDVVEYPQQQ